MRLIRVSVSALLPLIFITVSGHAEDGPARGLVDSVPAELGTPTEAGLEAEFGRTREALRAMPEFQTHDAATHLRLGERLAHRGDMNGAKEEYRVAIRLQPDLLPAYRGLGQVLLDHHEYADAVPAWQEAVRLDGEDGQSWYWLGRAYMGTGQWAKAEAAFARGVRLKPEDPEMHAELGLVRMAQAKVVPARQAIQRALELRPDGSDVHHLMDILRTHPDDPQAVQRAARAMLATQFARE